MIEGFGMKFLIVPQYENVKLYFKERK